VIWKSIAGKKISRAMALKLATVGETGVLKGFKSKAGKRFDARLKLQNNKVQFVLEWRAFAPARKLAFWLSTRMAWLDANMN
jgi:hypothetical protein